MSDCKKARQNVPPGKLEIFYVDFLTFLQSETQQALSSFTRVKNKHKMTTELMWPSPERPSVSVPLVMVYMVSKCLLLSVPL